MRKLTWKNLGRHLLAYFSATLFVGIFLLTVPFFLGVVDSPNILGRANLPTFVFAMGLLMGLFYAFLSGPFVLAGIAIGSWIDLRQWWYSALWGSLTALVTARLFHDHSHNLDARFYFTVSLAGLLAGLIYWFIAVRPRKTET